MSGVGMHSLRFKITAVTIAAILTSILSLGLIGIFFVGIISNQSSVEKMNLLSENIQEKLDVYLNSLQQSVDMAINIANDSTTELEAELISAAADSPEQMKKLNAFLKEHSTQIMRSFTSIANNSAGVVTYYYCINMDLGSSENGFFYSKVEKDNFEEQEPLRSHDLDPNDLEHTTWYYSPIKHGAPIWIGPYLAHYLNERLTVSYVAPIYKNDILLGVLGMDILFETMVEQISSLKIYDTGFAFLLDEKGIVLYHPDFEWGSKPDYADKQLSLDVLKQKNNGSELIRYNANGEYRQLSFSTLSNGMKLVVTAPVAEITKYQRQLINIFVLVAVLILIIFTAIVTVLMDHIIKPLLRLTAASQKLAEGEYDIALDYHANDEVGVLTNSFQQMRDRLKLYIRDLNSRAYNDALTGIKNKAAFNIFAERLNDSIRMGNEVDTPKFALILLDCNNLKQINDEFGHDHGDIYLKTASSIICNVFSHSPVFRIGGDEFVVLLQKQDLENRDQLLKLFDQKTAEINAGTENSWEQINISKGIAIYEPGIDKNVEEVLHRADEQMYKDKKTRKLSEQH